MAPSPLKTETVFLLIYNGSLEKHYKLMLLLRIIYHFIKTVKYSGTQPLLEINYGKLYYKSSQRQASGYRLIEMPSGMEINYVNVW